MVLMVLLIMTLFVLMVHCFYWLYWYYSSTGSTGFECSDGFCFDAGFDVSTGSDGSVVYCFCILLVLMIDSSTGSTDSEDFIVPLVLKAITCFDGSADTDGSTIFVGFDGSSSFTDSTGFIHIYVLMVL